MRLFISGGGTGGHVYPALAVAEQLGTAEANGRVDAARVEPEILWIGSPDGVERALVEAAHIPFRAIQTGALRGKSPLTALANAGKMVTGIRQSLALIDDFRPEACLVTGGYVCAPVTVACRIRRIPVLVYLPDMTPGLAIRWLSRLARRVAVSFREVASYFGDKALVTGYPVRADLLEAVVHRDAARRRLAERIGIDWGLVDDTGTPLPLLLVLGGSRGARSINRAIWAALPELLPACQVLHIVGVRDWPRLAGERPVLAEELARRYHPVAYLHEEMAWALASAHLAVARAGASTLAEFPVARLPAVLVPLPIAGGHQRRNAEKLAQTGGAVIVADEALSVRLRPLLLELLADEERLLRMGAAIGALARPQAALNIAQALVDLGHQGNRSGP